MAQYARRMLWAGVRIVGGCCGITPEHIRLVRAEARSLQPGSRVGAATVEESAASTQALPAVPVAQKSGLGAKLAAGDFISFVEILPPRGVNYAAEIAAARACGEAGIDGINVPDGPRASARMSAQATCQLMQQQAGIEAVLHFCCRDRNILGIQSELLGAHALGIRNLICITGDPPRMGSYPGATAVFDVDSIGLVNIVSKLNRGLDIGGNPMNSQTSFLIGVGANPGAMNLEEELHRFESKVQAGAEYAVTQPVFDLDLLKRFLERISHVKIPVIAGIWPLTSYRNAEFMVNELRVPVPESIMSRMRATQSSDAAAREGIAIAREMVTAVRRIVQGVQLSAPFGRYAMALEVAQAIRSG
jgi:homocysteine S-methyltransferase